MSMQTGSSKEVGLKADAVSLWGDFVFSIANVAPSSSVAYTLAILLRFAGHVAPLAVLVVGPRHVPRARSATRASTVGALTRAPRTCG